MASGKNWKHWSQRTYHSWVRDYAHFIVPWSITLSSVRGEERPSALQSKAHTANYWEWTPQQLEPALQQTVLLCKTIQSDSYNLCWDKCNLLFLFCWQWLCLHRQTEQRRRSRAAEKNTVPRAPSWHDRGISKDLSSLLRTSDWMVAGVRCTRQAHGIVFLIWACLHLSPGQKWVCQLLPLAVLQLTLQMAMGCKEWMCIKLNSSNIQSRGYLMSPNITSYSGQDYKCCDRKDEIKTNKNWTATGSGSGWKVVPAHLIHSDVWSSVRQHARKTQPVANNVEMISSLKKKKAKMKLFLVNDFWNRKQIFSAALFNCRINSMAKVFMGKYN